MRQRKQKTSLKRKGLKASESLKEMQRRTWEYIAVVTQLSNVLLLDGALELKTGSACSSCFQQLVDDKTRRNTHAAQDVHKDIDAASKSLKALSMYAEKVQKMPDPKLCRHCVLRVMRFVWRHVCVECVERCFATDLLLLRPENLQSAITQDLEAAKSDVIAARDSLQNSIDDTKACGVRVA